MSKFKETLEGLRRARSFKRLTVLGILTFALYWFSGGLPLSFALMGPPIYAAQFIKKIFFDLVDLSVGNLRDFALLLPVTLLYFSLLGFQLGILLKERGWLKYVSVGGLLIFVAYVHYIAWQNLSGYYIAS